AGGEREQQHGPDGKAHASDSHAVFPLSVTTTSTTSGGPRRMRGRLRWLQRLSWIQDYVKWIQFAGRVAAVTDRSPSTAPSSAALPAPVPVSRRRRLDRRLAGIGATGGVLSGLLGVGGGIVMVPLLVLRAGYPQRE